MRVPWFVLVTILGLPTLAAAQTVDRAAATPDSGIQDDAPAS